MINNKSLFIFMLTASLSACSSVDDKNLESSYPSSNVALKDSGSANATTGTFKRDSTETQRMVAKGESANKEQYIEVAPGSLAVDTDITMKDGAAGATTLPTGLGGFGIVHSGPPLLITATGDVLKNGLNGALSIFLPVPLEKALADKAGLTEPMALTTLADEGKLAIEYMVITPAGNKHGLFILGKDNLVGTIIKYAQEKGKLGWFRLVLLSASGKTVEITTTVEPK